ncbi:MAG TPA: peptidylprolyl isomerase [Woeseiaceae bacterium]|nr:peptidylprolyl isomerase [Woeseiaceae bacterium]
MRPAICVLFLCLSAALPGDGSADAAAPTMGDVLAASTADDWYTIPRSETLYLTLPQGEVVMMLAPQFAPAHIANLRKLVQAGYFGNAAILRSQDNYVVQWSSPGAGDGELPGGAARRLAPEFYRDAAGLDFVPLASRDAYARSVGFADGFAVGRDGRHGRAWLLHCYGALGAGRASEPDSGNAAELYVVTGHAPRHLDRNVTLLGRVIDGMQYLSSLPRGSGALGFYEHEDEYVPIRSLRFANDADAAWQVLKTDTATFKALVAARRHRAEDWFVDPADAIGVCNVPLPARKLSP